MKEFKLKGNEIKKLIDIKGGCICSDRVTIDGKKIGYMYREEPSNEVDSGWRFFEGAEDEEYTSNPNNFGIYELNTICNYDNDIIPYLNEPIGTEFEREENTFKRID